MVKNLKWCTPLDELCKCTSRDLAQLDGYLLSSSAHNKANFDYIQKEKRRRYETRRYEDEARRIAFGPAH